MWHAGINGSADTLGITCTNTWHIPVDRNGDAFPPLKKYFADPFSEAVDDMNCPAFITFPSEKDRAWKTLHPEKITCQILIMAKYEWFSAFADRRNSDEYYKLKSEWEKRALKIFFEYFPQVNNTIYKSIICHNY